MANATNNMEIINIDGVECYEKDGTAYLKLETAARGLGFTRVAASGNKVVRWERIRGYLREFGVPTCGHDDFIPENIFYRLAMKAKNAVAEAFQAKVADEIIPSIRKHGAYIAPGTLTKMLTTPEAVTQILTALLQEQQKCIALEADNAALTAENTSLSAENAALTPKADYYDALVDHGASTNLRDTAKEFGIGERKFVKWLIDEKYLYRKDKKLRPYAAQVSKGLFEIKDYCCNGHAGVQTLITPKGRMTLLKSVQALKTQTRQEEPDKNQMRLFP